MHVSFSKLALDRVKNAIEGSAMRVILGTVGYKYHKVHDCADPSHTQMLILHQILTSTRSPQPVEHAHRMQDMDYRLCEVRSPVALCSEEPFQSVHCSQLFLP